MPLPALGSLLVGAIPYAIAAYLGGRVAWGIQGGRLDSAKERLVAAELARDNWREVAAKCGADTLALEADHKRRLARAARDAQAARAGAEASEQALERLRAQRAARPAGEALSCDEAIDRFREALKP